LKNGRNNNESETHPIDWEIVELSKICFMKSGTAITNEDIDEYSKYPCFGGNGLRGFTSRYTHEGRYALIGRQGAQCGNVLGVEGHFFASEHAIVVTAFPQTDICWLTYVLADMNLNKYSESSAQPGLSVCKLLNLNLVFPPLQEQRAIASALSDVDALISALDRLIAKKRDIKQAVMQELLTGKTRLPGFRGEWEVKRLGEIGIFLKGSGIRKDEAQSGNLPCIRYGEIYTHHNDYIKAFNSRISSQVAATATRLRRGDLLFAGSGETKEEIGKCVAFIDDFEAYAGGDIVIHRANDTNPFFMGFLCNTTLVNTQKASKGQGDAVVHISTAAISSIVVTLPPLSEQTAIAEVFSDMDEELSALEQRRDKTRALKQGMMQELLTGKTRLV
jgi:type I restriction enzyme, S subunit